MQELRTYTVSRLNRKQFGFIPRVGIDEAKLAVSKYVKNLKNEKK